MGDGEGRTRSFLCPVASLGNKCFYITCVFMACSYVGIAGITKDAEVDWHEHGEVVMCCKDPMEERIVH